jgi:hypothetical protein
MRAHFRNDRRVGHFVFCLDRFDLCVSLHFVVSLARAKEQKWR